MGVSIAYILTGLGLSITALSFIAFVVCFIVNLVHLGKLCLLIFLFGTISTLLSLFGVAVYTFM